MFFALNPQLWRHPLGSVIDFIKLNSSRRFWNAIMVMFLSRLYKFDAPWFYAPFLILVTAPVMALVLFFGGVARFIFGRMRDKFAALWLANFLFLLFAAMTPSAPKYDGVRLFLPVFVFMGLLAGFGFDGLVRSLWNATGHLAARPLRIFITGLVAALIMTAAGLPFFHVFPYGLEYYNRLIGGVKGAQKYGLETTYWCDVINDEAFNLLV